MELNQLSHNQDSSIKETTIDHQNTKGPSLNIMAKRHKTSQRIKFESEVSVIKKKLGDLETLRVKLGLTQRKICQLLLVDPSAWSRWIRGKTEAPPHIYRALHWYFLLQEQNPLMEHRDWLSTVARVPLSNKTSHINEVNEENAVPLLPIDQKYRSFTEEFLDKKLRAFDTHIAQMEQEIRKTRQIPLWIKILFITQSIFLLFLLFKSP